MNLADSLPTKLQHNLLETATVETVENGLAKTIRWPDNKGRIYPVQATMEHVSVIKPLDQVYVQATKEGMIVSGKVPQANGKAAAHIVNDNGVITINGAEAVRITTDNAMIEVTKDGKISIDSNNLQTYSKNKTLILGNPVSLN